LEHLPCLAHQVRNGLRLARRVGGREPGLLPDFSLETAPSVVKRPWALLSRPGADAANSREMPRSLEELAAHTPPPRTLIRSRLFMVISPAALDAIFFSCREENIRHRAHRDHRERSFCSRAQGLQGCCSLFVGPQSLPASLLRDLCGLCGEILLVLQWAVGSRQSAVARSNKVIIHKSHS
jgi:hypothetical protein